jgi:hypothetical protein
MAHKVGQVCVVEKGWWHSPAERDCVARRALRGRGCIATRRFGWAAAQKLADLRLHQVQLWVELRDHLGGHGAQICQGFTRAQQARVGFSLRVMALHQGRAGGPRRVTLVAERRDEFEHGPGRSSSVKGSLRGAPHTRY